MCKETENNWKNKAVSRSKILKTLNKDLVRQKSRANDWHKKAQLLQQALLSKDLIIKELSFQKAPFSELGPTSKIGSYKYDSRLICLCVKLYKSGLSLRQAWFFHKTDFIFVTILF